MTHPAGCPDTLRYALKLVGEGLPCFPCDENKRPLTLHGFKDASRDPECVRAMWHNQTEPLIGVPTGKVSGLDVVDIDPRNGGGSWFVDHKAVLGHTRVHRTRSGGLHFFFGHQAGLRCSAGKLAPGVDVRACGGYVIWWPASGIPVVSDLPAASWPASLSAQLCKPPSPKPLRVRLPDNVLLAGLVRAVAMAHPGQRNSMTYWAACRAGEMVASGLLDAGFAADVITEAAARAGLPDVEARRTAWSGIRKTGGLRHA
jgi:hypothetical protein